MIHVHLLSLLYLLQILGQIQIIDIIIGTFPSILYITPTQWCEVANDHKEPLAFLSRVKPITITEDLVIKSKA